MTFPKWFIWLAGGLAGTIGPWATWVTYVLLSISFQINSAVKAAESVQGLNVQFIQETSKRERLEDKFTSSQKELEDKILRLETALSKLQK